MRVLLGALAGSVMGGALGALYTVRRGEGPDLIVNVPGGALVGAAAGAIIGAVAS